MKNCIVCGQHFNPQRYHAKTCSGKCRQTLNRRKRDAKAQAVDIGVKLEKLMQGYTTGAIDHNQARAIVAHIERRFDNLRSAVEAEQLQRLMQKHPQRGI
jgi:predicted nucleic acid-binding Zn ribbon protein